MKKPPKGAALGIGMNYIRFAIEEPHLFRFLFQSDYFSGKTLLELIDAEELLPVLTAMQSALGMWFVPFPKRISSFGFSAAQRMRTAFQWQSSYMLWQNKRAATRH